MKRNESESTSQELSQTQNFSEASGPSRIKIRSLAICGPIVEETSVAVMRALLALEAENPKGPIVIFINTPGGNVYDSFAIYDVMQSTKCPIITVGFGRIMSAGVLLLSAGDKGDRYAFPNSYFMTHDLQTMSGGSYGDADSQHIHAGELRKKYIQLLSKNSKLTLAQIKKSIEHRESYFSASVAKTLGIIDHISVKKPKAFFRDME